ncbi:CNH domain-containing protein, partial [Mycena galopus ATCC 62051]
SKFYIPAESTSIHYLKTRMCIGCSKGFEIVDLESLETQGLLDPSDESLEFVRKRENLRPMAICRINNDFLLCYDGVLQFAFYVNRTGRRSRKEFMVFWEGTPTGFALHEPYVLAFEPSFVEIRHVETGLMSQVIQGSNLRLLFADTPPSERRRLQTREATTHTRRPTRLAVAGRRTTVTRFHRTCNNHTSTLTRNTDTRRASGETRS